MLQLKNISKKYITGYLIQDALNDVSLNFRDNEFVSILGPSGSGKTTLLNIIGGLDRYDKGDLIINNISTKNYKDRDWDSYRNHTIGFVFQSYNLIPHQSVLSNVEIALTISGVSKRERKRRALEALDKVGLKDQAHKKPNQMSGGQMQRVAIARALVNDPDILLADEPTGALDTETSLQVMELLKKVADDRLVIMVTHNPELASAYSTRIVNLKDGRITGDTNPYNPTKKVDNKIEHKNLGKSSMSLFTALILSLNNLLTKKGRTILTAFAGSIGIIGIALILSLSTGFQKYIDKVQEDALTSYPLTINKETADATSILLSMVNPDDKKPSKENSVLESQVISDMLSKIGTNDLASLKKYLLENKDEVDKMVSLMQNNYSVNPLIYSKNKNNEIIQLNPSTLFNGIMSNSFMGASSMNIFTELVDSKDKLSTNYEVVAGRWGEKFNEVILLLPNQYTMPDLLAYSLGLRDSDELNDMISNIMKDEKVENTSSPLELTYDELMNIPLKLVDASNTYKYNSKYKIYEDMKNDKEFMKNVYDNSVDLKIVGIVVPKKGSSSSSLSAGIGYSKELTEYVITEASKSEIVKKQLKNEEVNVFNNKRFDDKSSDMGLDFKDMISIDSKKLSQAFGMKISEKDISNITQGYMGEIASAITTDTTKASEAFILNLSTLTKGMLHEYVKNNNQGGVAIIKLSDVDKIVDNYLDSENGKKVLSKLEKDYTLPSSVFKSMYSEIIKNFLNPYISAMATNSSDPSAPLVDGTIDTIVDTLVSQDAIIEMSKGIAAKMTEANMQKIILGKVGELTTKLIKTLSSSFKVDESKFASAFKFNLGEAEMKRLIETMSTSNQPINANTNLLSLGYQDFENPNSISFYFKDFETKEKFIDFLNDYNAKVKENDESKVIQFTDITGILMSSVKTIVDAVSLVLIAFVSISLIVSSIMIGIITYISVLERTKEIGILRAIGASKRNISSIFNAETFIVGLFSGILGIGVTLLFLIPINAIINALTGNIGVVAILPLSSAIKLIILSVILTLIGGLIPAKHAAKKDPVIALRTE